MGHAVLLAMMCVVLCGGCGGVRLERVPNGYCLLACAACADAGAVCVWSSGCLVLEQPRHFSCPSNIRQEATAGRAPAYATTATSPHRSGGPEPHRNRALVGSPDAHRVPAHERDPPAPALGDREAHRGAYAPPRGSGTARSARPTLRAPHRAAGQLAPAALPSQHKGPRLRAARQGETSKPMSRGFRARTSLGSVVGAGGPGSRPGDQHAPKVQMYTMCKVGH